jgi:undecaprenyl-diphosphatase
MPSIISLIILGIIQGITEFIPISSSGHLVLSKFLLGFPSDGVLLEVALHAGTLVPILIFYRKRIFTLIDGVFRCNMECCQMAITLIVATIPAVVLHLTLRHFVERLYHAPLFVAFALCMTGMVLILPIRRTLKPTSQISILHASLIGIAQGFALMPGISRSGSTITMARHLGIEPAKAAEFSFFMAIPVLAGAIVLEIPRIGNLLNEEVEATGVIIGMLTSAVVGYFALAVLMRMLAKGKFWIFGIYCLLLGATASLFLLCN